MHVFYEHNNFSLFNLYFLHNKTLSVASSHLGMLQSQLYMQQSFRLLNHSTMLASELI